MRTKFFTGTGDRGQSVLGKQSFSKDDPFFEFLGTLDELNSWLGFCQSAAERNNLKGGLDTKSILLRVQDILFIMQAEVAGRFFKSKIFPVLKADEVNCLERIIEVIDKQLPPLKKFIIPGGTECSARLDVARAIARRVERLAVKYSKVKKLSPDILQYLNRLSSMLFALSRHENFIRGIKEKNPTYS